MTAQLSPQLDPCPCGPGGRLHRSAGRPLRVTCRLGPWGLGPDLAVRLLDLSQTGIRLMLKVGLRQGQEVQVVLSGPGNCPSLQALANVVWSVAAADGHHCAGLRFQRSLPYASLQGFRTALYPSRSYAAPPQDEAQT